MRSLRDAANQTLVWVASKQSPACDILCAGDDIYATYQVEPVPGTLFGGMVGRTAEGAWAFRRAGWITPRLEICHLRATTPVAVIDLGGNLDYTLVLDGERFQWKHVCGETGVGHDQPQARLGRRFIWRQLFAPANSCWYTDAGALLMRCIVQPARLGPRRSVVLSEAGAACEAAGLLALLALVFTS